MLRLGENCPWAYCECMPRPLYDLAGKLRMQTCTGILFAALQRLRKFSYPRALSVASSRRAKYVNEVTRALFAVLVQAVDGFLFHLLFCVLFQFRPFCMFLLKWHFTNLVDSTIASFFFGIGVVFMTSPEPSFAVLALSVDGFLFHPF